MLDIKSILQERAPAGVVSNAEIISALLASSLNVEEMKAKRGADFSTTAFYQIRIKPTDRSSDLQQILNSVQKLLSSPKGKSLKIKEVQINSRSRNSSKYSSVSFNMAGFDYDIVVAAGANRGEDFEKTMLLKMDNLVAGIEDSEEARKAFAALESVDPAFKISNIAGLSARSGSTQRSGDLSPEEVGKIIADIIITLKKGGEKYVSIKNKEGSTVAQFGISKAFTDDLKVNAESEEWKSWVKPFGLDVKKIEEGMVAARDKTDVEWNDVEQTNTPVSKKSAIFKIMQKLWGSNYYYLREVPGGFKALKIDENYVSNVLLSNLKVTEIRYPSKDRKQITIYLESDSMRFKLELRNPRGKGSVRPTQIQLVIMKTAR